MEGKTWSAAFNSSRLRTHELIELQVHGAPCQGILDNWTIYLRQGSTDAWVMHQILIWHELEFLRKLFPGKAPINIIDLGGNAGLTSLYMATLFKSARLVVVEPSVANFLTIQANTMRLRNVFQEHAGIWGHPTMFEMSGKVLTSKFFSVTEGNIRPAGGGAAGGQRRRRRRRTDRAALGPAGAGQQLPGRSLAAAAPATIAETGQEWGFQLTELKTGAQGVPVANLAPGIDILYIIDKYGMQGQLSFVKIDVECAEGMLFAAENKPEAWLKHVTCFSIEIHEYPRFECLPAAWEDSVLKPLLRREGFQAKPKSGELTVWCHEQRHKAFLAQ